MGCLIPLFALISPRLALFVILIFENNWLERAFDGWIVPVLGFFLLPWTTLAWVVMYEISPRGIDGFDWLIVGFAFVVDIMSYAKTSQARGRS